MSSFLPDLDESGGMGEAFIAASWCPLGCVEVVFAKCNATSRVFAVCTACGCAWFDPHRGCWEPDDFGECVSEYHEYAPQGFVLASRDEIRQVGFEHLIVEVQSGAKWAENFSRFHAQCYGKLARPGDAEPT